MEILTKRLKLIPCREEDVKDDDPREFIRHYLDSLREDPDSLGWGVWLVKILEDGSIIGDIGFKGKPDEYGKVEIGYGISAHYQNKGYATEAVEALLNWVNATGAVKIITAECLIENSPSIKVLNKLGLKEVSRNSDMIFWEKTL
ncbi:GNAT family N-acetyltransferase [Bacillus lacus]|uniref:GNAT family N-acetyltransferase n=1 Tax=Metabacillus lacus TaxID=1983721 RepID=A0A7X2IZJ2_9BACI|nr:GNAT family N-acetyltransferase [Metabacillus lacus]MRX72043.1 GNAT family N-acetyltransferase [Metabacillus lacus]